MKCIGPSMAQIIGACRFSWKISNYIWLKSSDQKYNFNWFCDNVSLKFFFVFVFLQLIEKQASSFVPKTD